MTLIDARTVAWWPLDEQHDSVLPVDGSAHLPGPTVPAGLTRPPVLAAPVGGFGREFVRASSPGLLVADTAGQGRLTRGVTVVVVLRLDVEVLVAGSRCTLIQRGRGGAGDPVNYRLALEVVNVPTRQVRVRLSWQTTAGVDVADDGVLFLWPAGEYLLVAATREVVDEQLAVRYQVNQESALGGQAHPLDCGGAVSADVSLGMGMAGAAYQDHLDGVLDSLHVLREAVSPEEFEWTWKRLVVFEPQGMETARRMVPRGVYSRDPDSRVQRELAIEGALMGYSKALGNRLRDYLLPDRAWGEVLDRWERITGHVPRPADHLQLRRDRVLSFVGTIRGFALDDVRAQMARLFDIDAADVQILEYDNDYSRAVFHGPTPGTPPEDALQIGTDYNFTPTFLGITQVGDWRYQGADRVYGGFGNPRFCALLWPLAHGDDAWMSCHVTAPLADGCLGGLMIGRRDLDEWIWIGIGPDGSSLAWLRYRAGVLDSSLTVLAAVSSPAFLWVHHTGAGSYELRVGATLEAAQASAPYAIATGNESPQWVGLSVVAPASDTSAYPNFEFRDLFFRTPKGHQRFNWFAYRDPAAPGNHDMLGARLVVRRIKPAHTIASACTTTAVECDDADNGCDQAPLGA